jgi:hypothetical protein
VGLIITLRLRDAAVPDCHLGCGGLQHLSHGNLTKGPQVCGDLSVLICIAEYYYYADRTYILAPSTWNKFGFQRLLVKRLSWRKFVFTVYAGGLSPRKLTIHIAFRTGFL